MDSTRRTARLAGLLYLVSSLPAPFALIYVPGKVFVEGDPAATGERLRTLAGLVRAGIAASMVSGIVFIFMTLVLYRLFKPVSESSALAMLVLIAISYPITFHAVVHQIAALNLAVGSTGSSFNVLAAVNPAQRDALAYLALRMHHNELMVAEVFWGLWLFPFGICVMRSGFIPRVLGVLLMIAGCGYVADSFAELAFPQYAAATGRLTSITNLGEVPIIFWLLIWGARPLRDSRASSPADAAASS